MLKRVLGFTFTVIKEIIENSHQNAAKDQVCQF